MSAKHDKTKVNVAPTMRVLSREDPRCHGLAEGFCKMACDTCPFVSQPIKDAYINKYNMQLRCDTAHKPPSVTAEQPVQQTLAIHTQPTSFQFAPLGAVANGPFDGHAIKLVPRSKKAHKTLPSLFFRCGGPEKEFKTRKFFEFSMSGSIASDALVAVAPKPMSMPPLGKLTRAQMEKLLSDCFKEQRPPTIHELCIPMPKKCRISYKTDRTGTGLFDILDDDTLAEVLFRVPIGMRIVFAKSLCKQVAALAHEHKVFKAMYISPCGGYHGDSNETANNMLRTVGNWSFLTMDSRSISPSLSMTVDNQIEELKLREGPGRTVDLPPTLHLQ